MIINKILTRELFWVLGVVFTVLGIFILLNYTGTFSLPIIYDKIPILDKINSLNDGVFSLGIGLLSILLAVNLRN